MKHILRCHDLIKHDIVRADNCYLYDKSNNRYVDFESGIWCAVVGHSNPRINRRMIEQINNLIHLSPRYTSYLAEGAAVSLLHTISGKDGKCLFLSSGSEAVEFGINVARLVAGKKQMLTLSDSYLGAYGHASTKGDAWIKIDFDKCSQCESVECADSCPNLDDVNFDEIGAFVFEPGSSSGKVKFPPQKLIQLIVGKIRKSRGLVVVDEVTTGLGRTGKWYGFNHYGIEADIIAFGKGLGNGYPVSAVALRKEIALELEKRQFRYVQSHQNDPLGCAIAIEVVKIIKEDDLVNRSSRLGEGLIAHLGELKSKFQFVKDVRGRGLMASMEFAESHDSVYVEAISNEMLRRGFIIGFNATAKLMRFLPPLTIEETEISRMAENLDAVLGNQC